MNSETGKDLATINMEFLITFVPFTMRNLIYNIFIVSLPLIMCSSTIRKRVSEDYCSTYGIIYFVDKQNQADLIIKLESDESIANMLVYKEDNRLMADTDGVWYITDNPALAKYRVFMTNNAQIADFTVCYIEDRAFAGCQF